MNDHDPIQRRRQVMIAQGAAALACFFVVHGAHAATMPIRCVAKAGAAKSVLVTPCVRKVPFLTRAR